VTTGVFPNFFVIGAPKAGTTSLYEYLRLHPQIFMSPMKEPHFFSWGLGSAEGLAPGRPVIRDPDEYRRLFAGVTDETVVGEASSSYLRHPEAAMRIRQHVPEARLVAILRDPIDRAYSAFLMLRRLGREPLADFDEAIRAEQRGDAGCNVYLARGFYARQLERYLGRFPRQQLQVHLYDDLRSDPAGLFAEVCRFLGVDDRVQARTSRRYNVAGTYRSNRTQRFLEDLPRPVRSVAAALFPENLRRGAYWKMRSWNTRPADPMPRGTRRRLVPLVRQEILALQDLIGRDLSAWLDPDQRC
jgi:hypothetical protein